MITIIATGFAAPAFSAYAHITHAGDEATSPTNGFYLGQLTAGTTTDDGDTALTSTGDRDYWPQRARTTFTPERHPAASEIRLRITGIQSVAFHSITVEYSIQGVGETRALNLIDL